jgi:metal-sulfur cluster biosynthetic enzyme
MSETANEAAAAAERPADTAAAERPADTAAAERPADTAAAEPAADEVVRGAAGMPEPPAAAGEGAPGDASLEDIEEAMRDVVDPELGINVVDLGLVYGLAVEEKTAVIDMTLTSAACPLTDVIEEQTRAALTGGPSGGLVDDIRINWVWMPPWGPEKITEDGREQLRALGFRV